jgi:hypothetical protein
MKRGERDWGCERCVYWGRYKGRPDEGGCRRRPPGVLASEVTYFRGTRQGEWCVEFEALEDDDPVAAGNP